jgi:hypothetical protein
LLAFTCELGIGTEFTVKHHTFEDRVPSDEGTLPNSVGQSSAHYAMPVVDQDNKSASPTEECKNFEKGIDRLKPLYKEKSPLQLEQIESNPHAESSCLCCEKRLACVDDKLEQILTLVRNNKVIEGRKFLTPAEFAAELKRHGRKGSIAVIRRHCRDGGIKANKRPRGRGKTREWMIPVDEVNRYMDEGPLRSKPGAAKRASG